MYIYIIYQSHPPTHAPVRGLRLGPADGMAPALGLRGGHGAQPGQRAPGARPRDGLLLLLLLSRRGRCCWCCRRRGGRGLGLAAWVGVGGPHATVCCVACFCLFLLDRLGEARRGEEAVVSWCVGLGWCNPVNHCMAGPIDSIECTVYLLGPIQSAVTTPVACAARTVPPTHTTNPHSQPTHESSLIRFCAKKTRQMGRSKSVVGCLPPSPTQSTDGNWSTGCQAWLSVPI